MSNQTQEPQEMSLAFIRIMEYASAIGVSSINTLPGAWTVTLNGNWKFYVNGHNEPIIVEDHMTVEPFHAAIFWNGWPAGIINPYFGTFAGGSLANEDTFITALDQAIEKAKNGNA